MLVLRGLYYLTLDSDLLIPCPLLAYSWLGFTLTRKGLGAAQAKPLGSALGEALGVPLGDTVGTTLGDPTGPGLGRTLGAAQGTALGDALGPPLKLALGSELGDALVHYAVTSSVRPWAMSSDCCSEKRLGAHWEIL